MARMIDRLMASDIQPPQFYGADCAEGIAEFRKWRSAFREKLPPKHVVIIDNVAEYLYAGTDQEDWNVIKDFPNVAPPFEEFWMEYHRPSKVISRKFGLMSSAPMPSYLGFYCVARKRDEVIAEVQESGRFQTWLDDMERDIHALSLVHGNNIDAKIQQYGISDALEYTTPDEYNLLLMMQTFERVRQDGLAGIERHVPSGWMMEITAFAELRPGVIGGPFVRWSLRVNQDGSLEERPEMYKPTFSDETTKPDSDFGNYNQYLFPCLLSLSFLHCKNVTQVVTDPIPKLNRARVKEGKPPFVRFHTLEIEPMKKVLRHQGREHEQDLAKALHICRGHFADYRNGAGLFGKHKGVYWWDSQVKGSKSKGVVVKEYDVQAKGDALQKVGSHG